MAVTPSHVNTPPPLTSLGPLSAVTLVRLLAGILLLTGCASYPSRTSGALRDFRSGHFLSSAEAYVDEDLTGSGFLSGAEAGTVALAAGSWEQAIEYFEGAANAAGYLDERGALSRDNLVENPIKNS